MTNRPKIVFGGIDGTGEFWNHNYEKTFVNSHINTLYKEWIDGPAHYRRGPWWQGDWTWVEANRIFNRVKADWKDGAQAVFLAGYSRGGAAVIEIAKWLKAENIPVECMVLLDPVDRSRTMGDNWWGTKDTAIVDTVKRVIYAQRDYSAKSRESFGNCGRVRQSLSTIMHFDDFFCTHGAVGGVPWTEPKNGGFINEGAPDFGTLVTVEQDKLGSEKVKNWVFPMFYEALFQCIERLSQPTNPVNPPTKNPVGGPNKGQRIHIVEQGEWLSKIALKYYGDMMKYDIIHKHPENYKTIGPDPNIIKPGQRLIIP